MDTSKTFQWNDRIRQERIRHNWRQQDLAEQLGTSVLTIHRWERGSHQPSAYFRIKLCTLFGISTEEFGFGSEHVSSPPAEEILSGTLGEIAGSQQETTPAPGISGEIRTVSPDHTSDDQLSDSAHISEEREMPIIPPFWQQMHRRRIVFGLAGLGLVAVTAGSLWLASRTSVPVRMTPQKQPSPVQVPQRQRSYHLFDANASNWINHLAWSPNGTHLAVASGSNVIEIWNIEKEAIALSYPTLNAWVNDVSWSNTNWIASTTAELHAGSLQVWKFPEKTPLPTLKRPYALRSVCWSPNSQYLAFSGHAPVVEVWDPFTPRQINQYTDATLGLLGITRVKWSPSGRFLACAADDGTAHVWKALAKQPISLTIYRGHQGSVHDLAWSPDERAIVSCSTDKTCHVWEVSSGRTLVIYRGHTGEVEGVDWSPLGTFIASASADHTAQVWLPSTGRLVAVYGEHSSIVETVHWSADETKLAVGTEEEGTEIWQAPRERK